MAGHAAVLEDSGGSNTIYYGTQKQTCRMRRTISAIQQTLMQLLHSLHLEGSRVSECSCHIVSKYKFVDSQCQIYGTRVLAGLNCFMVKVVYH